jgi:hypothetical protein
MALAIRFEGLLQEKTIRDYAELASRGRVTRARITQIMKLLHLAPDLQEHLLFLPPIVTLNERNLRAIVSRIELEQTAAQLRERSSAFVRLQPQTPPLSPTRSATVSGKHLPPDRESH